MIVAVTGGIGSGKSRVCQELAKGLQAESVSADAICKNLLAPHEPGWQALHSLYGRKFFRDDDSLDRVLLRRQLFTDKCLRAQLDDIIHPMVREEIARASLASEKKKTILLAEVPLLFEKGWQGDYDWTLLVFADQNTCVQRVCERDLVTEKEARQAVTVQMDMDKKKELADIVIDNSGSFQDTCHQLRNVIKELLGKNKKNP